MSGAKAAEVLPKLENALKTARDQISEIEKNAARIKKLETLGLEDSEKQANLLQHSIDTTTVSDTVVKFVPDSVSQLNEQRHQTSELLAHGKNEAQIASRLLQEAESLHNQSVQMMEEVVQTVNDVTDRVKRNRLGWYLDVEDAMARQARKKAQDALRLEKESADKLRSALDHSRQAKTAFDSAISMGNHFIQKMNSTMKVALERETAAKIAEENERNALSFLAEIDERVSSIGLLNHLKFAPGEYQTLSLEVDSFHRLMATKNYAQAAKRGEDLCNRLSEFEHRVSSLQTAFETAQIAAQNALCSANQELATFNRDELVQWSGAEEQVTIAYTKLEEAATMIDSEHFATAEEIIIAALNDIRRLAKTAEENKFASQQRTSLAEVIMNALYEQGYDAPTYYYSRQKQDGSDVEFSDLTIFAKAPGNRGDMRLNIDLTGNVKLEVEGIAEGEETVCHQLIQDLQKGVGEEIDFHMTDWGRAANVDSNAKAEFQQQEKVQEKIQEKTRERHNG